MVCDTAPSDPLHFHDHFFVLVLSFFSRCCLQRRCLRGKMAGPKVHIWILFLVCVSDDSINV